MSNPTNAANNQDKLDEKMKREKIRHLKTERIYRIITIVGLLLSGGFVFFTKVTSCNQKKEEPSICLNLKNKKKELENKKAKFLDSIKMSFEEAVAKKQYDILEIEDEIFLITNQLNSEKCDSLNQ